MPCCTTCEEVREAYRKKGWAISNPKVSSWGKVIVTFRLDSLLPQENYVRDIRTILPKKDINDEQFKEMYAGAS